MACENICSDLVASNGMAAEQNISSKLNHGEISVSEIGPWFLYFPWALNECRSMGGYLNRNSPHLAHLSRLVDFISLVVS